MARVTFQRLTCEDVQERASDEPYLLYNGRPLAGPFGDVDEGESREINKVRDLSGEALVQLFEEDWPDADDFLSRIRIYESEAGQGQRSQPMHGHGAEYTLFYVVE
jgi:hypothetical protein